MDKYRISKYDPKYRNSNWSIKEYTWTSFSDIIKYTKSNNNYNFYNILKFKIIILF